MYLTLSQLKIDKICCVGKRMKYLYEKLDENTKGAWT